MRLSFHALCPCSLLRMFMLHARCNLNVPNLFSPVFIIVFRCLPLTFAVHELARRQTAFKSDHFAEYHVLVRVRFYFLPCAYLGTSSPQLISFSNRFTSPVSKSECPHCMRRLVPNMTDRPPDTGESLAELPRVLPPRCIAPGALLL